MKPTSWQARAIASTARASLLAPCTSGPISTTGTSEKSRMRAAGIIMRYSVTRADGPCRHSSDDLDRSADRETEIAVGASLIDGDFREPVRILIPERLARRPIAEGHRTLQHSTHNGQP